MKKSVIVKRALIVSIISMFISVLVFVGSTFAWFTDSATVGKNSIMAGNLDVNLYRLKDGGREEIVEDTEIFKVNLWEPGAMAYETFEVTNNGDLALKYRLAMKIWSNNKIAGTDKSLIDVLKVAIVDGAWAGTREEAMGLDFAYTLTDFQKEDKLLKGNSNQFTVFVYWMPSDIDNEYNLNNGIVSSDNQPLYIDLGINLSATQQSFEADSFGSDYDEDVTYTDVSTTDELLNALSHTEPGQGVRLTTDIAVNTEFPLSPNAPTIINLDGHKLSTAPSFFTSIENDEELVVRNGNFELSGARPNNPTLSVHSGGSLVLENVDYTAHNATAIYPKGDAASVKIINSNIVSDGFALSTNANAVENYGVSIEIVNSTLTTTSDNYYCTVMVNIPCNLSIDNSNINGRIQALVLRGGNTVIKNSVITNSVVSSIYDGLSKFYTSPWLSGNNVAIAAVTVGNYKAKAYQYPTNVTIENSKITSEHRDNPEIQVPAIFISGNETEGLGASLTYNHKENLGLIQKGNEFVTVIEN